MATLAVVVVVGYVVGRWARRVNRRRRGSRWYREVYLQSPHWRSFRRGWWARHGNVPCSVCGFHGGPLDLHHVTYKNLWHERDEDVRPVCRRDHDLLEERKGGGR